MANFDIRAYQPTNPTAFNDNNLVNSRIAFLKYMNEHVPLINQECGSLVAHTNERSKEAFTKKLDAWKGLVENLDILLNMYNINTAA